MLTPEEDVEITSLKKQGWSISAIARRTCRDRKSNCQECGCCGGWRPMKWWK